MACRPKPTAPIDVSASHPLACAPLLPTGPHLPRPDQLPLVGRALVLIRSWVPLRASQDVRDGADGRRRFHSERLARLTRELEGLRSLGQHGVALSPDQTRRRDHINTKIASSNEFLLRSPSKAAARAKCMARLRVCIAAGPHQSPARGLSSLAPGIQVTIWLLLHSALTAAELSVARRWLLRAQAVLSDFARSLSPEQMRADVENVGHAMALCMDVGELHLLPALLGLGFSALRFSDQPYLLMLTAPSLRLVGRPVHTLSTGIGSDVGPLWFFSQQLSHPNGASVCEPQRCSAGAGASHSSPRILHRCTRG